MPAACVFCEIVSGKLPAHRVFEGKEVVAFLDARPLFQGHVLVVPVQHSDTLLDLKPAGLEPLFTVVQKVARAVETGLQADGSFVAINNRVSQSVPHLHVHVVPRSRGDGLRGFFWPRRRYADAAEQARVAAAIRGELERAA